MTAASKNAINAAQSEDFDLESEYYVESDEESDPEEPNTDLIGSPHYKKK